MSDVWVTVGWCVAAVLAIGLVVWVLDRLEQKLGKRSKAAKWTFRTLKGLFGLSLSCLVFAWWYGQASDARGLVVLWWGVLALIGILPTLALPLMLMAGQETSEDAARRRQRVADAKARRKAKAAEKPTETKKRGPISGSRTAEIMLFGDDPTKIWAARKVRDRFF